MTKWHPSTKHPITRADKVLVTMAVGGVNSKMSSTHSLGIRRSKEVLARCKHGKTHYRLGEQGWKDYPDSQAGKYKYFIVVYVRYEDGDQGWEDMDGNEYDIDSWTYLPNTVTHGYTW